jgi:O-antigen ligase
MSTQNAPVVLATGASAPVNSSLVPAPPSWVWRRGALILAGAAPLITISAAVAGLLVLIAGIAGSIVHTGLFFVPALVVLAVGGMKLQREQARPGREE